MSPEQLASLKKDNRIYADPVDSGLPKAKARSVDIIVAASAASYDTFKKSYPTKTIKLVDHHVDPRLPKDLFNHVRSLNKPKAAYFGEPSNAILPPAIRQRVTVIPVNTARQSQEWLKQLQKYNIHYAVRLPNEKYNNKPFLKGFTAAHSGAVVIIHESDVEALRWVGGDYPYKISGGVEEENIIKMLDMVESDFGNSRWAHAQNTMQRILSETSEFAIHAQLKELFR